jgi:hypothetical protein
LRVFFTLDEEGKKFRTALLAKKLTKEKLMPDPTHLPTPEPEKKKRTRGVLNKAQVEALTKAEQIGLAAQKPVHAPRLAARDITAGFVTTLLTDVDAARKKAAAAVRDTTGTRSATLSEDSTEQALLVALHEVQAAARQKYARSEPAKLLDYLIGTRLNQSRPLLEQNSETVIEKLGTDSLPGITAAKVTNLITLRAACIAANSTQGGSQSDATSDRAQLGHMIDSITDRRLTIQFAADAEYPCTDDKCHGPRKEFSLPLSRPFSA